MTGYHALTPSGTFFGFFTSFFSGCSFSGSSGQLRHLRDISNTSTGQASMQLPQLTQSPERMRRVPVPFSAGVMTCGSVQTLKHAPQLVQS